MGLTDVINESSMKNWECIAYNKNFTKLKQFNSYFVLLYIMTTKALLCYTVRTNPLLKGVQVS